ncbi:MAG: TetR/AcrR family transcriptional regulator [Pseudobdellovibrionaceae bacterium]|nr:TetR/AcrR family transcriptional regulator [Pseudobdellovibrionaceae bacterium]
MGRTKLFERADVTDKALQVFWRKGYVDTSLKDLEKATGVFKPALYSEFGDKEGLFIECVKYYRANYASKRHLLLQPYGWKNIENFLRSTIPTKEKPGCFEAAVFARDVPIVPEKLKPLLDENTAAIVSAIKANLKAEGLKSEDIEDQADSIFTIYCGLGVLADSEPKTRFEQRIARALKLLKNV